MASPEVMKLSFVGGEITPEAYGRLDLSRNQTGAAKISNFWVRPSGALENRSGFEFVAETDDSTKRSRLIEFNYSPDQQYVLEFGEFYVRAFATAINAVGVGGAPSFAIKDQGWNYAQILPGVPAIMRIDQGMNLSDQGFPVTGDLIERNEGTPIVPTSNAYGKRWRVGTVTLGAPVAPPTGRAFDIELLELDGSPSDGSLWASVVPAGVARWLKVVTPYTQADLPLLSFAQNNDILTIVHPNYPPAELRRTQPTPGEVLFTYSPIAFAPTLPVPGAPTVAAGGPGGGSPVTYFYRVTALADGTLEESLPSAAVSASRDLTIAGNFINITPATVVGAVRYNVYKLYNGLYGFISQTEGGVVRDNNIAPDMTKTIPFAQDPFVGADNYPSCVGYFEQRRVFANTNNRPQNYWMTVSGTEKNLNYSQPQRSDDAISGRLAAQQAQRILQVASLGNLVFLTSGGEWKFGSSGSNDPLTPANAFPKQDSAEGSAPIRAVPAGGTLVYVGESGSRVRKMEYKWSNNAFTSEDLSILGSHLFDEYTIVDIAFQKAPVRVVWVARSDGLLLGMTYHPEHDITAWHQHPTAGIVESVAVVKNGKDYPLHIIVRRVIGGRTVRYIERLTPRLRSDIVDSVTPSVLLMPARYDYMMLDCAAQAPVVGVGLFGGPAEIRGLQHLVGQEVSVVLNGARYPNGVVDAAGGLLVYDPPVNFGGDYDRAHIGLAYTSELQTLPVSWEGVGSLGQGVKKNVVGVDVSVYNTATISAGPDFSHLREFPARSTENYDGPPDLKEDYLEIPVDGDWNEEGKVCLRNAEPAPVTIRAMVIKLEAE